MVRLTGHLNDSDLVVEIGRYGAEVGGDFVAVVICPSN